MLTLEELSQKVAAYNDDRISLGEFENWFEDNSNGAYDVSVLGEACVAIDAAFSEYYFDHIGENAMKAVLVDTIRSFEGLKVPGRSLT